VKGTSSMTQNKKNSKDTYWFKHDSNARTDSKIVSLRREFGLEGYGLYWCLVEIIREETDYRLDENRLNDMFFDLHIDEKLGNNIVKKCISLNLFKKVRGKLFSESLLKRMINWDEIRAKRASAGAKGGQAKAKQMLSKCQANAKQSSSKTLARRGEENRGEENRGEENRVKKKIDPYTSEAVSKFIAYYNVNNKSPIRGTNQQKKLIAESLTFEDMKTWNEVIEKSANKGFNFKDGFKPLSFEKMIENYSKILDDSYNLKSREASTEGIPITYVN